VISDDVYSSLIYDGKKYQHFASYKNNWERTLTVFSAGKLMNCTGWKVGWVVGPAEPIKEAALMHEISIYNVNVPGQFAIAESFDQALQPYKGFKDYYDYVRYTFEESRGKIESLFH
jgi:aspartate/methionine/tyrosine aminotransferase